MAETQITLSALGMKLDAIFSDALESEADGKRTIDRKTVTSAARRAAKENRPDTAETELSADEREIANTGQSVVNRLRQGVSDAIRKINADLRRIRHARRAPRLEQILSEYRARAQQVFLQREEELVQARTNERYHYRELRYFKSKHGREYDAEYAESWLFQLGLLLILVVIEAGVNMVLFAANNDLGLLGGWIEALFVSLANVATAFGIGFFCVRYLFHRDSRYRALGLVGTCIGVLLLLVLLLTAAHYRDALGTTPAGSTGRADHAFSAFLANPFGFETFQSFALLVIGTVIAAVAMFKGVTIFDKYPGYGAISRRYRDFARAYEDVRKSITAECMSCIKIGRAEIDASVAAYRERVQAYRELAAMHQELCRRYEAEFKELQRHVTALVQRFREVNADVRTTPPPQYFAEPISLEGGQEALDGCEFSEEIADRLDTDLEKLEDDAETLKLGLEQQLKDELARFEEAVQEAEAKAARRLDADSEPVHRAAIG